MKKHIVRLMISIASLFGLLVGVLAVSAPPASPQSDVVAVTNAVYKPNVTAVQNMMLLEINRLRAQNHLGALRLDNGITNAWSNQIVQSNAQLPSLHHDPNQPNVLNRLGFLLTGENLASTPGGVPRLFGSLRKPAITDDATLAVQIVEQYYDDYGVADYGHRKNLLNPYFTNVGIAFALKKDTDGNYIVYNALDFGGNTPSWQYSVVRAYFNYSQQNGLSGYYPTRYTPSNPASLRIATVTGKWGVQLDNGYGPSARYTGRTLPKGSQWQVGNIARDTQGKTWYLVGGNQWIDAAYTSVNF